MDIAVDFDGTCVDHIYPRIGVESPNCSEVLWELISNGHRILLNTMRGSEEYDILRGWFRESWY